MPSAFAKSVTLLLCACMGAASCSTHRPVASTLTDRPLHRIHLAGDVFITVNPPQTARWEDDSVVIRDRNGGMVNSFARADVVEAAEREERPAVAIAGALIGALTVFYLVVARSTF
jgi:hypothetical protein